MLTAIGDVMREAHKRGWITTRDGNCSLRRSSQEMFYITPSGVRKTTIIPETVVRMPVFQGKLVTRGSNVATTPSGELEMHWLLQKCHSTTRAVLHLHPTYTIAAMRKGYQLNELAAEFPEVYRYTRVGQNVPVLPATSKELAKETFSKFEVTEFGDCSYDIVGQAQHGVCAIGRNPWDAFEHIERLEHICKITLASGV